MKGATKLTSKGQVVIPKALRETLRWRPGTKLTIEAQEGAVVLRPTGARPQFGELMSQLTGFLTEGDPLGDLEADHRAEVEEDERWRRPGRRR